MTELKSKSTTESYSTFQVLAEIRRDMKILDYDESMSVVCVCADRPFCNRSLKVGAGVLFVVVMLLLVL